jgi:hypothetical protein
MIKKCESLTLEERKCKNKAKYCLTSSGQKINICYSHMKYYKNKGNSRVSSKDIFKRNSVKKSYDKEKSTRILRRNSYEYDTRKNKLSVKRISRVPHDRLTNLPIRYTRGLSNTQKLKYLKEINETRDYYAKTGKVRGRSPVSSLKPKRSRFVEEFERKYNFKITDDKKLHTLFSDTDIDTILSKGRAAYASGSRPTVTGSSGPERWARARLASVLVGGKALAVDKNLVGPKSLRRIFS